MPATVNMFGMRIHAVDMQQAVDQLFEWCGKDQPANCRYVVTPNVDHAVIFQSHAGLQQAYESASLVVADGAPVILASRLLKRPLPERVAGSDLVPALFDEAVKRNAPLRVFYLGAGPGVAERAATETHRNWPQIKVVGTYSPPLGFEFDEEENSAIAGKIAQAQPDVLLVGLGAPKQELWIARHASRLPVKVALCVGATIDFLAGERSRSPRWLQRLGLEWLHRLATEPRRLAKRYARDAWIFPQLVLHEWWTSARFASAKKLSS